jgi:hypothetical protein
MSKNGLSKEEISKGINERTCKCNQPKLNDTDLHHALTFYDAALPARPDNYIVGYGFLKLCYGKDEILFENQTIELQAEPSNFYGIDKIAKFVRARQGKDPDDQNVIEGTP